MSYPNKAPNGSHSRIEVTDEFISRNNLTLKRTSAEAAERIKASKSFLGFDSEVLINFVTKEDAKGILSQEGLEKLESGELPWSDPITDVKEAAQDFLDYLVFAWGKALDQRGISASRSIEKLNEYLWILGREDLQEVITRDSLYNPYGMPALIAVSLELGIPVPANCHEFAAYPQ